MLLHWNGAKSLERSVKVAFPVASCLRVTVQCLVKLAHRSLITVGLKAHFVPFWWPQLHGNCHVGLRALKKGLKVSGDGITSLGSVPRL